MKKFIGTCIGLIAVACGFGITGCDCSGKSAYDIAVENGFDGTVEEWLDSLHGNNGQTPEVSINDDGYWVINGVVTNVKAVAEDNPTIELKYEDGEVLWSKSNSGTWSTLFNINDTIAGYNGDDIVLKEENGKIYWKYVKDTDWVELIDVTSTQAWLCGDTEPLNTTGSNGDFYLNKQSYSIFQKVNGVWLNIGSIKGSSFVYGNGAPNNALGRNDDIYLDLLTFDIYTKSNNVWTNTGKNLKGESGVGVKNISCEYLYDNDGQLNIKFTFTLSDLSSKTITIAMPKYIKDMALVEDTFVEGSTTPTLQLNIVYDNDSSEVIDVTNDMIIAGSINYNVVGRYDITIRYLNKTINTTVIVSSPYDRTISKIKANQDNIILLLNNDTLVKNYVGLSFDVIHKNNESYTLPLSDAIIIIDESNIEADKPTTATISYKGLSTTVNILPVTNLKHYNITSGEYIGNTRYTVRLNENPFGSSYIKYIVGSQGINYVYNQSVSVDMLNNDASIGIAGIYTNCSFKNTAIYYPITTKITLKVFDLSTATIVSITNKYTKIAKVVSDGIPELFIDIVYNDIEGNDITYNTRITEDMVEGEYDFTQPGEINLKLKASETPITILLYDNDKTVKSIALTKTVSEINIPINTSTIDATNILLNELEETPLIITYYVKNNGFIDEFVYITEEMLNLQTLDTTVSQTQQISITYAGKIINLNILVVEN